MKFEVWTAGGGAPPATMLIRAPSARVAEQQVQQLGLQVLGPAIPLGGASGLTAFKGSGFSVDLFAEDLLALLRAGFSVVEAVRALLTKMNQESRQALHSILKSLNSGQSFAAALEAEGSFPEYFTAVVRASERTSNLPDALERYLAYARQMNEVRQKLVSAAVYPALLIVVGLLAFAFLLGFVMPRFAGVYEGLRGKLPWTAELMLAWGRLVRGHGLEIFTTGALALVGMGAAAHSRATRSRLLALILRAPGIGEHLRLFHLTRLYRTLGMLLDGGLAIHRGLDMALGLLPETLRPAGQEALRLINEGQRPSAAFLAAGLATPISDQMLAAGEAGGDLGSMMTRIADFYESDTTRKLERLMRIVEPLLMLVIGLGIGVIIIMMYLPIFELAGAIQ